MSKYKSVQDLIIKAAMYDGVSTTIRPTELIGGYDAIELVFFKGDRHSCVSFYEPNFSMMPEDAVLWQCKHALYDLFKMPYEEIVCEEEAK